MPSLFNGGISSHRIESVTDTRSAVHQVLSFTSIFNFFEFSKKSISIHVKYLLVYVRWRLSFVY